ncbi:MAG: TPM domain-containing protein [Pseudomonadota bacterium]
MFRRFTLAALTVLALVAVAFAQLAVPALTGRVVDNAGLIDATSEARITSTLLAHEQATGEQIAVLTLPSLEGEALEDYSLRVARQWSLGQADLDTGALLLVAQAERKIRIEVGYGLEGRLTDAQSGLIIRNRLTPAFRQGDFSGGIEAAVAAIIDVLGGNPLAQPKVETYDNSPPSIGEFAFFLLIVFIFFGPVIFGILVRIFGRQIRPGQYRWLGFDVFDDKTPRGTKRAPGKRGRSGTVIFPSGHGRGGSGGFGGGFSGGGGGFGGGGASGGW